MSQTLLVSASYVAPYLSQIDHPQAVKEILESFKDYKSVPSIARVWKHTKDVEMKLRTQLDQDFDAL